jgi:hypothetical protein
MAFLLASASVPNIIITSTIAALQLQPSLLAEAKVAPLNTFSLVKDEFDARKELIDNFVFQTWNAFSTDIGELLCFSCACG